jgi:UDP-N-acetylglucosamine diphosphorylase / glucose-1-phosphate thymidylyltransferase / UDP-N-acetylgalactosamine diphosphorylase / glucosamine-1-phosphate N-acetyltransferase / galactosamine-1-phosphate N-acetyltransferase
MKTAVILAAGQGKKLWPYGEIRPKPLVPIANKPVIDYSVSALIDLGFTDIIIAAGPHPEQFLSYYKHTPAVRVINCAASALPGTAETLRVAWKSAGEERILVLYGDILLDSGDLELFIHAASSGSGDDSAASALVCELGGDDSRDWICCTLADGRVSGILGHPREEATHRFCGFIFDRKKMDFYLEHNSGVFKDVEVGAMPPLEKHLEISLSEYIKEGGTALAVTTGQPVFDIDKPWHILEANDYLVKKLCGELYGTDLGEGAEIDSTADVQGYVRLGRNSRIGRNVVIKGNVLIGENTKLENGAIINGNAVIGNDCYLGNYCYMEDNSTIGDRCVVNHCAELCGIIMENVYLYHYMELFGIIGMNTDIGAATVCGTLRFDDGDTPQRVQGRREHPGSYSNAVFLGDSCRTGVNTILMPGSKVGPYSVIGPGVVVNEDVPSRTSVFLKQELVKKTWGPERYGW